MKDLDITVATSLQQVEPIVWRQIAGKRLNTTPFDVQPICANDFMVVSYAKKQIDDSVCTRGDLEWLSSLSIRPTHLEKLLLAIEETSNAYASFFHGKQPTTVCVDNTPCVILLPGEIQICEGLSERYPDVSRCLKTWAPEIARTHNWNVRHQKFSSVRP